MGERSELAGHATYVEWLDSFGLVDGPWHTRESWRVAVRDSKSGQHRSIGFVVYEDERWVVLAGHEQTDGNSIGSAMAIPKFAITRRDDIPTPLPPVPPAVRAGAKEP